jgi:hypothetical protein
VTKTNGDKNTQFFGINDERIQNFVVTQQDYPISSFFGYTLDGIFQTDDEALAAPQNHLGTNQNKLVDLSSAMSVDPMAYPMV